MTGVASHAISGFDRKAWWPILPNRKSIPRGFLLALKVRHHLLLKVRDHLCPYYLYDADEMDEVAHVMENLSVQGVRDCSRR